MSQFDSRKPHYEKNTISLLGAVALGTGVMIGAGILAVTGQIAELAGALFPWVFALAALVSGFSAYAYVKLANAFPSAGGIASFLREAYGSGVLTGGLALLMYLSMVLNQSLVARTFGTYTLQAFGVAPNSVLVPILGIALLCLALVVNLIGTRAVQGISLVTAVIKVAGLLVFSAGILWSSGLGLEGAAARSGQPGVAGFLGAIALGVLAFKGFTTITNSGSEIVNPHRNVGRAIVIAIAVCALLYVLVSLAVGSQLTVGQIVQARDYSLAEAAQPMFGDAGLWFTVLFAIVATTTGVMVSVFAVSRMLAMLTEMGLVPHSHFGMPGDVQKHTVVYTVVIAIVLTAVADLGRIAALGAIVYILMDVGVQWSVIARLREQTGTRPWVPIVAIALDSAVLGGLVLVKIGSDILLVAAAAVLLVAIFGGEWLFLRKVSADRPG